MNIAQIEQVERPSADTLHASAAPRTGRHKSRLQSDRAKSDSTPVSADRIMQLAWGYAPTMVLETAVRHRIFDRLQTPRTLEELAAESRLSRRGLTPLLNCLIGLEFLRREEGRYSLTPESAAFLVPGKAGYLGAFFTHMVSQVMPRWQHLEEAVRTGRPVAPLNHLSSGEEFFADFVESLFPLSYGAAKALARHLGLGRQSGAFSILDVGAGSGVWGIALAQEAPRARMLAVDWPKVLEVTRRIAERHGVADRLSTSGGDLLEADFGKGHRVATIGHILHSEGARRSRALLRRVYAALEPGGTVAIAEFLPNQDRTEPPNALIFAVNMLINTEEGDTFSFEEISGWLSEAGFTDPRLLEAPGPSPLVLATRPAP